MLSQAVVQILADSALFPFADLQNNLFQPFALADVADRARYQNPFFRFQGTQADLDRKLVAVFVQGVKFDSASHRSNPWLGKKVAPVRRMAAS